MVMIPGTKQPPYDPMYDPKYNPNGVNLAASGGLPTIGARSGGINTSFTGGVSLPGGVQTNAQLPMNATDYRGAPSVVPAQEVKPVVVQKGVVPKQETIPDPVTTTSTLGSVPGTDHATNVKNFLLDGLKGLGSTLAESGFAMAYRSGGNKDDYAPEWDRATRTGNPNSAYSENVRNLLANNPRYQAQISKIPKFGEMSGDEAQNVYSSILNKEGYMDTMAQQSKDRIAAVIARENAKRQGRGGGSTSIQLSKQEMAQLPKYSALKMGHESLHRDFDELKKELGVTDLSQVKDLPGLANVPLYGVMDNGGKGAKIRSLIEKIIAPERHKLFGSALTGVELGSANRIFGQSGYTDKNIIDALARSEAASREDYDNLDAGYTDNVTNYRENKLNKIKGNTSTPSGSGGEEVIDYTQFGRKK